MVVAATIHALASDLATIVDSLDGLQEQRRIGRNERVEIEQCALVPQERRENVGFRKTVGPGTPDVSANPTTVPPRFTAAMC
jgi:hypothetical protein